MQALRPGLYGPGPRHTRQAVMEDIFDVIVLILIWIANGGLVIVFWLIDHLLLLVTIPAFYLLVAQARQEQRLYALAAGGLSLDLAIDGARWYCLDLPSPIELVAGKHYWLVLKVEEGRVNWHAQSSKTTLAMLSHSQDGGTSWVSYKLTAWGSQVKIAGRFRLRHLPAVHFPPIEISAGLENIAPGGLTSSEQMAFSVDFTKNLTVSGKVPLSVTAHAMGQLTLSNLRIEYKLPVKPLERSFGGRNLAGVTH